MRTSASPPTSYDVTFENCQARERTLELMDYRQQERRLGHRHRRLKRAGAGLGHLQRRPHEHVRRQLLGVPKTLVRHIVQYVADTCGNDTLRDVLVDILDTPVSPELLPAAADGDDCPADRGSRRPV